MIQGAINQLIGIAAAAKVKNDVMKQKEAAAAEREQRQASREQAAKDRAMQRARDKIEAKFAQNTDYKRFVESLGNNQAPEMLKLIAYEEHKRAPEVRVGKDKIDITRLSPEAQEAIKKEMR